MEEKLIIQQLITLRNQWEFFMKLGKVEKAAEAFQKMVELGNKYPQLARMIQTGRLAPTMINAGFTVTEAGAATAVAGTAATAETTVGTAVVLETAGTAATAGSLAMTVGVVIAIALVLGVVAFAAYQYNKYREHHKFINFARDGLSRGNFGLRPFLGRAH